MATETIVTGKKYRILTDAANKVWNRVSFWHKASDCEFNDGKTAEAKLGVIDGITDSTTATSSRIAASAKAVSSLSSDLGKVNTYVGSDGKLHFTNSAGADTVLPFKSASDVKYKDFSGYSFSTTASELGAEKIIGCGMLSCAFSTSVDNSNWSYNFDGNTSYNDTSASGTLTRSNGGTGGAPNGNFTATWRVYFI